MAKHIASHYNNTILAGFLTAMGEFLLDDFQCYGQEWSFAECTNNGWGSEDCGTSEHVTVVCSDGKLVLLLLGEGGEDSARAIMTLSE